MLQDVATLPGAHSRPPFLKAHFFSQSLGINFQCWSLYSVWWGHPQPRKEGSPEQSTDLSLDMPWSSSWAWWPGEYFILPSTGRLILRNNLIEIWRSWEITPDVGWPESGLIPSLPLTNSSQHATPGSWLPANLLLLASLQLRSHLGFFFFSCVLIVRVLNYQKMVMELAGLCVLNGVSPLMW